MFGCAAVVITLLIVAELILPVTVKLLKFPRLVMLFNVPGDRVPLNVPPWIVPLTLKLVN